MKNSNLSQDSLTENLAEVFDNCQEKLVEINDQKVTNKLNEFLGMINDPEVNDFANKVQGIEKRSRKKKLIDTPIKIDETSNSNEYVSSRDNFIVEFEDNSIDGNYVVNVAPSIGDETHSPQLTFGIYAYAKTDEEGKPHSVLKTLQDMIGSPDKKINITITAYSKEGTIVTKSIYKKCKIQNICYIDAYDYSVIDELACYHVNVIAESVEIAF